MRSVFRILLACLAALAAVPASAADAVAFITNLKGEIAVDGAQRPTMMSELAKGQKVAVGKDAQVSVMYIQSGKEYQLRGPGDYTVGEREIASASGMPPAARETPWRANSQVLVKVAQTSAASIRMRSFTPVKPGPKSGLEFPAQGAIATLQPTLRWKAADETVPAEVVLAVAGKEDKPLMRAKVTGASHRVAAKLRPDTEYTWSVSADGKEIGTAKFRTLAAATIQGVEKRRPSEKAEFSDRVLYAMYLQEVGATEEAREAWAKLAREREDLPELAGLAR